MTDKEKANNYELDCIADVHKDDVCTIPYAYSAQKLEQAYLDGLAEGRKEKYEMALSQIRYDREKVIEYNERLQKENEELKAQLKNNPYVQSLQNEKAELAEDFAMQIEKMKCCGNCKHFMYGYCMTDKTCYINNEYKAWVLAE